MKRKKKYTEMGTDIAPVFYCIQAPMAFPMFFQLRTLPTFQALTSQARPSHPKGSGLRWKADLVRASLQPRGDVACWDFSQTALQLKKKKKQSTFKFLSFLSCEVTTAAGAHSPPPRTAELISICNLFLRRVSSFAVVPSLCAAWQGHERALTLFSGTAFAVERLEFIAGQERGS